MEAPRIFSGSAHPALARRIARSIGVKLGTAKLDRFADGEIEARILENIRGHDVFIVQPTCAPAENLLELLILIDAARRASADRVTAVIPYFGYARQDRKDRPRAPISAKLVANLITQAGADRVLTMDLHAPQIQGFFDIPLDHLYAKPILVRHFTKLRIPNMVVVAPDLGAVKMVRSYAERLGAPLAIIDKRRRSADTSEVMEIIGHVKGHNAVLIDDLISTAGTLKNAAIALRKAGARAVYAGATHPCFSKDTRRNLAAGHFKQVVVTDTIPQARKDLAKSVKVRSVGELIGEAIQRIHEEESLSSLFE
ncbi:MAG: ribose-phosphate diphosphokinase [Candidatus Eisenbacteria bacterium]|nr:ribose-phosphate diphosphokinase [Candidatus Eisenbacteria bacterium]